MGGARVALAGVHGHGRWHLKVLAAMAAEGRVEVVAAADPQTPADSALPEGARWYADVADLLHEQRPDLLIICTPTPTHLPLAMAALRAGADVLLEKPPVPGLAELDELEAVARQTGRAVQVGFQSLGSLALPALRELIEAGTLGEVIGVGAAGAWSRPVSYWHRSPWAGHRRVDGTPALDGALTNPFAHAIAMALAVACGPGGTRTGPPTIDIELYHANDIEADDTSCVRIQIPGYAPITVAATLCAPADAEMDPWILVRGTRGEAVFEYVSDRLTVRTADGERTTVHDRVGLLDNLLDHRETPDRMLAPLSAMRDFTGVLQAIRDAQDPRPIPPEFHTEAGAGTGRHIVLRDAVQLVTTAATEDVTFSALADSFAPWAAR